MESRGLWFEDTLHSRPDLSSALFPGMQVFSKHKEGGLITVLRKEKGVAELPITDADPKMPESMDLQITPHEDISWEQEGLEPLYFAASVS